MRVGAIAPVFGFSKCDPGVSVSAKPEIGRHHTNDGVSLTAHARHSSNHIRIVAEQPRPGAMTDYRNWSNAGLVILRREVAAQQRIDLEDPEEVALTRLLWTSSGVSPNVRLKLEPTTS